jgi:hypothetical protein
MIYADANTSHYRSARLVILAVNLAGALVAHPLPGLATLDVELIKWWGVLEWLPAAFKQGALSPTALWSIQILHGLSFLIAMALPRCWPLMWLAVGVSTLVQGVYVRGFGGHVNHQELTLLYVTAALALVDTLRWRSDAKTAESLARAGLFAVCLIVAWQYFVIGAGRVAGAPRVFLPNNVTMDNWIIVHGVKWNWWPFDISWLIADNTPLRLFFRAGLTFSTVFELLSPFVLFFPRLRAVWLPFMIIFHVGIWLTMSIFFWQNIVLLCLFYNAEVGAVYRSLAVWIGTQFRRAPARPTLPSR